MDIQQQNPDPGMQTPQKSGLGQMIGIIIIILIIVLGGIYFWTIKSKKINEANQKQEQNINSSASIEESLSDDTNLNIDAELNEIDKELQ